MSHDARDADGAVPHLSPEEFRKLGLYRNDTVKPVGVVYHDGFVQATTLADVLPVVVPPPVEEDPEPMPGTGVPPAQGFPTEDAIAGEVGCSSAGGVPLAAFTLLGLLGLARARRRRS